jgi:steroid 5-alpha reductase family enzyme
MLQGLLLFVIALPVIEINRHRDGALGILDVAGGLIWAIGFGFEIIGDMQLARFRKNTANHGKLMQSGLWRYSRHPNYFGEVVAWWGIWLIALSASNFWIGIISPLMITFLILKVSGIPLLEKKMCQHPQFGDYARRTSAFIPWFPK